MSRWALLLLLLLGGCNGCVSVPSHNDLRLTALRIEFATGLCSGTAVSPDTLWTAKHCLESGGAIVKINGVAVKQAHVRELSRDRVAVRVTGIIFKHIAKIGPPPVQGQRIRWFGNPAGNPDVYREGYIARVRDGETVIVATVCKGDSGSGLLSDKGEVIGIVSAMTSASGCHFGLSL